MGKGAWQSRPEDRKYLCCFHPCYEILMCLCEAVETGKKQDLTPWVMTPWVVISVLREYLDLLNLFPELCFFFNFYLLDFTQIRRNFP